MTKAKQKIHLVNGQYTPSEASDVVNSLIEENVNFHKLQRWSLSVRDESADTSELNGRMSQLLQDKQTAEEFIAAARAQGYSVRINGTLEISLEK
ncbi:MAG: hypothetical protein R3350_06955 [Saprospiraceae bacterium]|nr:hypothetical protein [Saprospiraceae bacterium]